MAFIGRPKSELILTDEEREELGRLARRARSAPWMWILYIPYLLAAAVNLIVVYLAGLTTQAVVTRLFGKRPG